MATKKEMKTTINELKFTIKDHEEALEQYSTDWAGLCATLNDAFYDGVSAIKIVDGTDCLAAVGRLIIDKKETDENLENEYDCSEQALKGMQKLKDDNDELEFKILGLEAIIEEQKHTLNKSHGNNAGLRKKIALMECASHEEAVAKGLTE